MNVNTDVALSNDSFLRRFVVSASVIFLTLLKEREILLSRTRFQINISSPTVILRRFATRIFCNILFSNGTYSVFLKTLITVKSPAVHLVQLLKVLKYITDDLLF